MIQISSLPAGSVFLCRGDREVYLCKAFNKVESLPPKAFMKLDIFLLKEHYRGFAYSDFDVDWSIGETDLSAALWSRWQEVLTYLKVKYPNAQYYRRSANGLPGQRT